MIRRALIGAILLLASCNWEVKNVEPGDIQIYVPEARFRAVKPGITASDVTKAIGAPREKQQGIQETWLYGVWRGEAPGFLKWLFRAGPRQRRSSKDASTSLQRRADGAGDEGRVSS